MYNFIKFILEFSIIMLSFRFLYVSRQSPHLAVIIRLSQISQNIYAKLSSGVNTVSQLLVEYT
jgi:hypothetical protein